MPPVTSDPDPDPATLTPKDVAAIIGMSDSFVRDAAKVGLIRSVRHSMAKKSHFRFRRSWVDAYIAAHIVGAVTKG
jgi:excisionase family DNA binding protein